MIDNFLRPPRRFSELAADALRVVGLLSVVLAAFLFELTDAGIIAFTLPGLLAPRFIGMKPGPDITISTTLLVAAWSNVAQLYTTIAWWDLVIHFACGGVLAMGCYLLLARLQMVPIPFTDRFTPTIGVVLTTALGLALGALWEIVEWLGYTYITTDIHVTYQDTVFDMAAGGLGAVCFGFVVAYYPLLRRTPTSPANTSAPPEDPTHLPHHPGGDGKRDWRSVASQHFRSGRETDLLD